MHEPGAAVGTLVIGCGNVLRGDDAVGPELVRRLRARGLPPPSGIDLHSFRWDHAIAFGRWLLREDYPARVTACLVEAASFEPGAPLSPAVDRAVDALADRLHATLWERRGGGLRDGEA